MLVLKIPVLTIPHPLRPYLLSPILHLHHHPTPRDLNRCRNQIPSHRQIHQCHLNPHHRNRLSVFVTLHSDKKFSWSKLKGRI